MLEKAAQTKDRAREYCFWAFLLVTGVFFCFFAGEGGYILWPDSKGYIDASYEREPFYPLVIMLCRKLLGNEKGLYGVVILQGFAALISGIVLTLRIRRSFHMNRIEAGIAFLLLLFPYELDTMWSSPRQSYTHIIMSDTFSYAMFYLFITVLIGYLQRKRLSDYVWMLVIASFMTWNRSQMELCYVVIFIAVLISGCCVKNKRLRMNIKQVVIKTAVMVVAAVFTIALTYCYSFFMWGEFARSSENDFTTLTNLLYASDAEDEALFDDPETAEAFRELYGRVAEAGLTYHNAPAGFLENGKYMLNSHDPMKSGIVRVFFREYVADQGMEESFQADQIKKELASEMKMVLLKEHFWRWIYDGLCMVPRGIMYSVTPVLPAGMENIGYLYTVFIIIGAFALYGIHIYQTGKMTKDSAPEQERRCLEKWIGCMIAFMGMNIVAVCIVILILYRYVNYTQGLFYIMLYLLIRNVVRGGRHKQILSTIKE